MARKLRILAVFMAVIFAFSQFAVFSSEMSVDDYTQVAGDQKTVDYLVLLGIISEDEASSFMSTDSITKGEAASLIVKSLGLYEFSLQMGASNQFSDLTPDQKYADIVAAAVSTGILSGNQDGTIGLGNNITLAQAAKMLVMALGYDVRVKFMGGYPTGYILMAKELKILNGVSDSSENFMSKKTFAKMLYNSFSVDVLKQDKIASDGFSYTSTETLEEKYLEANDLFLKEGIVESNKFTSIIGGRHLKDNEVAIGGVRLDTNNSDIGNYIGYRVQYVARQKDSDIIPLLQHYRITNKNLVYNLSRDNEAVFSDDRIDYYDTDKKRSSYIKLNSDVVFIYNNCKLDSFSSDLIDFSSGVKLIDNDNDDEIDVISWTVSQSFIVDGINKENYMIYLASGTFNGSTSVSLEEEDNKNVVVRSMDGTPVDWQDIQPKDAISIIASKNDLYLEVILLPKPFAGTATEIYETEKQVMINGTLYNYTAVVNNLEIDKEGIFYTNEKGEIFKFEIGISEYVYLIRKSKAAQFFAKPQIRVYDNNLGLKTYDLAEKVSIDGENATQSTGKAYDSIKTGVVVSLTLNSKGEVKAITNANVYGEPGLRNYCKYASAFNDQKDAKLTPFTFDKNTVFFVVPKNGNEDDYGAVPTYKDGNTYDTQAYDFDTDTGSVKSVVIISDTDKLIGDNLGEEADVGIVTKVGQIIGKDDQPTYFVEGYMNGKIFRYNAGQYKEVFNVVNSLKCGDVIHFARSFSDDIVKIRNVKSLKDWNDLIPEGGDLYYGPVKRLIKSTITNDSKYRFHLLYISEISDTPTRVPANVVNTENVNYQFSNYYIYDKSRNTITPATIDDIIPSSRGTTKPSTIFLFKNASKVFTDGLTRIIVIIKDN